MSDKIAPDFGTAHCSYLLRRIEDHIKNTGPVVIASIRGLLLDHLQGVDEGNASQVAQWAIARLLSDGRIRLYDRGEALDPSFVWNPHASKRVTPEALQARIEAFLGDPFDEVNGDDAADFLHELLEDLKDR